MSQLSPAASTGRSSASKAPVIEANDRIEKLLPGDNTKPLIVVTSSVPAKTAAPLMLN